MTLPPSITVQEMAPGYPVYEVHHPAASARIAAHGAHVMEWTPAGEKPVLYLSPQAIFEKGKPIRGGIPLCWPWFNAHPTDAEKPMHGLARIRVWTLVEASETPDNVTLHFQLGSDPETLALWPHPFQLSLKITIGQTLTLALTSHNTGETPFTLTEAIHTYFQHGGIDKVTVLGLDQIDYLDTVGPHTLRHQNGDVIIDREVDRQYASTSDATLLDPLGQRQITISKSGSQTTVVWNPWIEKSTRLADLPDEAYLHFLCIETANASPATVTVPPGQQHTITATYRVSPLAG